MSFSGLKGSFNYDRSFIMRASVRCITVYLERTWENGA